MMASDETGTLSWQLLEMSRIPVFEARQKLFLKDAAKLLEVLRLALLGADADDYDSERMGDGEIAIVRELRTISGRLDTLVQIVKEETKKPSLGTLEPKPDGN